MRLDLYDGVKTKILDTILLSQRGGSWLGGSGGLWVHGFCFCVYLGFCDGIVQPVSVPSSVEWHAPQYSECS